MINDKKQIFNKSIEPNERLLWHGTSNSDPCIIYDGNSGEGFDITYCQDRCMWGKGSYFAQNANYSDAYAYNNMGQKKFLLCLVALGECINLDPDNSLKHPPLFNNQNEKSGRYNSVSGFTNGSKVYIIYSMGVRRAYPYYEITYK